MKTSKLFPSILVLAGIVVFAAAQSRGPVEIRRGGDSGGGTNSALLNGTNVFTGTNTFSGIVNATNAANVLYGNGSNLTGFVQEWVLYKGPPNVLTNVTGGYGSSNLFHTQVIPAGVLGTNGALCLYYDVRLINSLGLMNATTTRGFTYHYNTGTNVISRSQFTSGASVATNQVTPFNPIIILKNTGTATNNFGNLNQIEGQPFGSSQTTQAGTLALDTSVEWTLALYGNVGTAALETNEWRNITITVKNVH
tara:strand:+ start:5989 stop:6744 length:756 start_codon:yes stop_codon:yes gene_type:complete